MLATVGETISNVYSILVYILILGVVETRGRGGGEGGRGESMGIV